MAIVQTDTVTRIRPGGTTDDLTGIPVQMKWPSNPYQPIEAYGHRVDCVMLVDPTSDGGPDILRGDTIARTDAGGFASLRGTNEFVVNGMQERGSPGGVASVIYYYLTGV